MCATHVVYGVSVVHLSTEVMVVDVKRERERKSSQRNSRYKFWIQTQNHYREIPDTNFGFKHKIFYI